eukprot:UN29313
MMKIITKWSRLMTFPTLRLKPVSVPLRSSEQQDHPVQMPKKNIFAKTKQKLMSLKKLQKITDTVIKGPIPELLRNKESVKKKHFGRNKNKRRGGFSINKMPDTVDFAVDNT